MSSPVAFTGSVPQTYHTYLGPMIFDAYARDMARRLTTRANDRILELACGTGIVTKEIARTMPPAATLLATDLNEAMINVARPFLGADPRVSYQAVDACSLPFADQSFDSIACQYGLMFFPDKVKSMQEARRVLKPGGRYILNVWDSLAHNPIPRTVHECLAARYSENPPQFLAKTPYGYFDRAEIERVVRAGGFTQCTIETIGFPSIAPAAEDAARAWLEGTPLFAALQERGVTDFTPIRKELAGVLAAKFGSSPCTSTMQAIVVTAS